MRKNNTFLNQFLLEFSSLWPPKMEGKFICFWIFIQKTDFVKIIVFPMENCYFLVLSVQNWSKFRCKFLFENYIGKNGSKIEFGHRFWFPKTTKIAPKSDAKQSLFRDAMETTPESSEVNGPHSFWITNMATHMIRSSWSAPHRPNHQNKVCNLTCSSHISAHWTRESKNIVQRH